MSSSDKSRPQPSWRQMGRDLGYLLPGLPIAVGSFTVMLVGTVLGLGTLILAFAGFFILVATLVTARGFAAAERRRVGWMEDREVGPFYHPPSAGRRPTQLTIHLRDAQNWRDWCYCIVIFPVRCVTWPLAIAWLAVSIALVPIIALSWAVTGNAGFQGLVRLLAYLLRAIVIIESSLVWAMLTDEKAAQRAAESAALRARAEDLSRSRQAVVQAEADTLRRVERDIHDGPQQRLVRLTMDLKSARRRMSDNPEEAGPLVEGALQQTEEALAELRALSRGIAPPILTDRGLKAALAAAAARNPIPTTLDVDLDPDERLPTSVENAAYFVVTESLANAAKHSTAQRCEVAVFIGTTSDDEGGGGEVLSIQVTDDGKGGAHIGKGHGLAGLADRLSGVDGQLSIDSPPNTGTAIAALIPISR